MLPRSKLYHAWNTSSGAAAERGKRASDLTYDNACCSFNNMMEDYTRVGHNKVKTNSCFR